MKDAWSWAGCTLPSDHARISDNGPVIAPKQHWYRRRNTHNPTIDTDRLVQHKDLQKESVSLKLPVMPPKESSWTEFGTVLQEIGKRSDYEHTEDIHNDTLYRLTKSRLLSLDIQQSRLCLDHSVGTLLSCLLHLVFILLSVPMVSTSCNSGKWLHSFWTFFDAGFV